MKTHPCPHCGKPITIQQSAAARSRWAKLSKIARSAEMSRRRKLGISKQVSTG